MKKIIGMPLTIMMLLMLLPTFSFAEEKNVLEEPMQEIVTEQTVEDNQEETESIIFEETIIDYSEPIEKTLDNLETEKSDSNSYSEIEDDPIAEKGLSSDVDVIHFPKEEVSVLQNNEPLPEAVEEFFLEADRETDTEISEDFVDEITEDSEALESTPVEEGTEHSALEDYNLVAEIPPIVERGPFAPEAALEELIQSPPLFAGDALTASEEEEPQYVGYDEAVFQLREGLINRDPEITIYYTCIRDTTSVDSALLKSIWNQAMVHDGVPNHGDYLYYYWITAKYGTKQGRYERNDDGTYTLFVPIYYEFTYYDTAEQQEAVEQAIYNVLAELSVSGKSDLYKTEKIYRYLCEHVTYDYAHQSDAAYYRKHSDYAALFDGTAVCQGYALLLYRMLLTAGIDTRIIAGTANGQAHAWNLVKLNSYYNMDSTWDAGKNKWSYFLAGNNDFPLHERTDSYYSLLNVSDVSFSACYSGSCGSDVTYHFDMESGELTVSTFNYSVIPDYADFRNTPWYELRDYIHVITGSPGISCIGSNAFRSCACEVVYLEEGLSEIKDNAFSDCALLNAVYFNGSAEQWYDIDIDGSNTPVLKAELFCSKMEEPDLVEEFVTRLYNVCLGREPDEEGFEFWVSGLKKRDLTGIQAANEFVFSNEFKLQNYCNSCYLDHLYIAFMGRESDENGKSYWMNLLDTRSQSREAVFNGFATSPEFNGICSQYGIELGNAIEVPKYGTEPTDSCAKCGKDTWTGADDFIVRLYKVCLDREPESDDVRSNWSRQLKCKVKTGIEVAESFVFDKEFTEKNLNNEEFVQHLYLALLGRGPDSEMKFWVDQLDNVDGDRKALFNSFAHSEEFTELCVSYGVNRG